ncbi:unnamed protein product [Prunus armeniaca]|uniref:Uncharacterized protein n=1 Tax=Prunus armeniaca TaxID=36596 RepID=A0A6J5Y1R5_PRUAR|nr:unnamed protein product [Prunus armeniaca]
MLICREPNGIRPPSRSAAASVAKKAIMLLLVNGGGDPRGQTSANPSKQQLQTNGGNKTSEISANQAHFVLRGIKSAINMYESSA